MSKEHDDYDSKTAKTIVSGVKNMENRPFFFLLSFGDFFGDQNGVTCRHYEAQTAGTKHTCFLQNVDNFVPKTCIFDRFCSAKNGSKHIIFMKILMLKRFQKYIYQCKNTFFDHKLLFSTFLRFFYIIFY